MIDRLWLKSLVEAGRARLLEAEGPLGAVDSAWLIERAGTRPPRTEAERLMLLGLAVDITEKGAHVRHDAHSSVAAHAVAHIRAHSRDRNISRTLTARIQGVSSSWLGHRLKQETGESATEHLTDARLADARHQLDRSDISVKDAALTAGFPSPNAFTNAFRRKFGTTPTAWRAQQALRKVQSAKRKAQKGR